MVQRIFVDSNVLASRTLRDWLFQLRNETDTMFQVHTTFDVLVETVRVFRRRNPTADGRRSRELFDLLMANVDEVLGDFAGDVAFDGPDGDDLHIHAAAVACRADKLLTLNISHFPVSDTVPYEVYPPDDFFLLVDASAPFAVMRVTRQQNAYWEGRRSAGQSVKPLETALVAAGCPEFAARVNAHLRMLSGLYSLGGRAGAE